METLISLIAIVAMVSVGSTVATRWIIRKRGALWVWDHSSMIGWALIGLGTGLIMFGFVVDRDGMAMSAKLGLGSLFLFAGLWMIW